MNLFLRSFPSPHIIGFLTKKFPSSGRDSYRKRKGSFLPSGTGKTRSAESRSRLAFRPRKARQRTKGNETLSFRAIRPRRYVFYNNYDKQAKLMNFPSIYYVSVVRARLLREKEGLVPSARGKRARERSKTTPYLLKE